MLSNQTLSSFFVFYGTATLFLEIIYSLVTSAKREAILFLFGCSEVNSTWLITSELANQRARKTLFTCVEKLNLVSLRQCGAHGSGESEDWAEKELAGFIQTPF